MGNGDLDFVAVGNLSRDLIHTEAGHAERIAGSSFYASLVAARLGARAGLIAKGGRGLDVRRDLKPLIESEVDVSGVRLEGRTASYELFYRGEDRALCLLEPGAEIQAEDVMSCLSMAKIALVSPIFREVPLGALKEVRGRCGLVCLDPQGYLRERGEGGWIRHRRWDQLDEYLKLVDAVSTSPPELPYLTGTSDLRDGASRLSEMGPKMVLITREGGSRSSLAMWEGEFYEVPVVEPSVVVDPGGAGDASTASFLMEWQRTGDPGWAALFASAASSFIYEDYGATSSPTRNQVLERLNDFLTRGYPALRKRFSGLLSSRGEKLGSL